MKNTIKTNDMKNTITITISKKEFEILYDQLIFSRSLIEYKESNTDHMIDTVMQYMKENIKKYNNLNN
tara:strand:- start:90 stop:293 length:204 start_codon:yes stop_codon:yes gene_type:complete